MNPGPGPKSLAERLLGKYEVRPDGCWIWTACTARNGYGKILEAAKAEGPRRVISAHVASYQVHKGPVPAGMEIDHTCKVVQCVNPEHLEAVTHAENLRRSHEVGGAHALRIELTRLERKVADLERQLAVYEGRIHGPEVGSVWIRKRDGVRRRVTSRFGDGSAVMEPLEARGRRSRITFELLLRMFEPADAPKAAA